MVPIHYNAPLSNLTAMFGKINGLLFPGGGANLRDLDGIYMKAVLHLWGLAVAANDKGDFFPIWGKS